MEATQVYRHLLRAVRKHIGKDDTKLHFEDFVRQEFRKNKTLEDQNIVKQKLKTADNYISLLNGVHHHKDLLFCYNIAVDREAEWKTTIRKTAARVGLQMPKSYMED